MGAQNIDGDNRCNSWSAETNWTISHGSLHDSVSFESSDYPIDALSPNSAVKYPLVLKPPAPDSGFCEIKINLKEKHEIRQVYVRSTARVYEIYFSPRLQSDNEYLCTVTCGIAAREKESLHASGSKEPAGTGLEGSHEGLDSGKSKDDENIGTSEDDWVEVKAPEALILDSRDSSTQGKKDVNIESTAQDLYEATAEMTDADPCISLTVRLLSLQSKGFVYIDEIYVYADLIESSASDNQENQGGNMSQSSLMAMLLPTFLNLPKTGLDTRERRVEQPKICSSTTSDDYSAHPDIKSDDIKSSSAADWDVKLPHANKENAEPVQVQIPSPVLVREEKPDSVAKSDTPRGHIERTLEQLVSRVHRIEDICLRFEENMLKPILGMEARLQRVEKQLEEFSKNSQLSTPRDDVSISVNYTQLHPCLAVTAPEFSCDEEDSDVCEPLKDSPKEKSKQVLSVEEKDSDVCEPMKDSPKEKPKQVSIDEKDSDVCGPMKDSPKEKPKQVSIDDALAAALAGFVSTSTVERANYTQVLTVKAPEFSVEENSDTDEITSPNFQKEEHIVGTQCTEKSVSSLSYDSIEDVEQVAENLTDGHLEVPSEVVEASNEVRLFASENNDDVEQGSGEAGKLDIIKRESELEILQNDFKSSCAISMVDFDAPIFDVKFASLGYPGSNSALEALLTDRVDFDCGDSCTRQELGDVEAGDLIPLEDGELTVTPTSDGIFADTERYDDRDAPSLSEDQVQDALCCGQETSASLI